MRTSKNILLIGNYPPPFGGVPRHLEYLAPHLVEKGWNVQVLSSGRTGVARTDGLTVYKPSRPARILALVRSLVRLGRLRQIPYRSVLLESPRRWFSYLSQVAVGTQIVERHRPSLISAYNLSSGGPIGSVLSEVYGIPLVVSNFGEIHSMTGFFRTHLELFQRITAVAKILLSCSEHCARSYHLIGLRPQVRVIPYGVDLQAFSPSRDGTVVRDRLGIPMSQRVILFVGRMIRDMGLHTLLDAIPGVLSATSDVTFLIVGARGDLFDRAVELQQDRKVIVIPDVPLAELPDYYAAASVLTVPTLGERACSSLAAMEAMATSRPVIAAAVGGVPEVVVDGVTGVLVKPGDPSELGAAIVSLLQNPALMHRMGTAGRQTAEVRFDQEKTNGSLEALFNELVNAPQ